MADLDLQQLVDFKNGLICPGAVGESKFPLTAVTESTNFNFNTIGAVTLRNGTTTLGGGLPGSLLGLYEFRDGGVGTNNRLVAVSGTALYYLSTATWTSKRSSLTALSPARFTTFLDYLWMVNGTEDTAIWSGAVGDSFVTTGNASGAPKGQYIENFRGRVWITGNTSFPDRVYYSSRPTATATPVVTWDTDVTTGSWIDISPNDGDNVTGIKRSKNTLLVFKRNHLYKIFSSDESEPDPKIYVGTYSNESIVAYKDSVYFHHPTGIYRLNDDGIENISLPVKDYLNNMSASFYTNVCGWTDGECIYFSIGDVTANGVTYSKVTLVYNLFSNAWTVYSYPQDYYFACNYNDGSTIWNLAGGSTDVSVINDGTTDNGTPIIYSLITRPYTFDGLFSTRKRITKLDIVHNKMEGGVLAYRKDTDDVNKWNDIARIEKSTSVIHKEIVGNKIWFRVFGSSVGDPFTFNGLEILKISSELIG